MYLNISKFHSYSQQLKPTANRNMLTLTVLGRVLRYFRLYQRSGQGKQMVHFTIVMKDASLSSVP